MATITSQLNEVKTLHYIYDPLCGWCYGIAPLIDVAVNELAIPIQIHGGGLFTPARKTTGGLTWQSHVTPIDARISQLSGQLFSDAYRQNLANTDMVLNSLIPISAIMTADKLAKKGVQLLKMLQEAYYVKGLNISDKNVILSVVKQLDIDIELFKTAFEQVTEQQINAHLQQTQQLMHHVNGHGFPTLIIERNVDDQKYYQLIPTEQFLGDTMRWREFLQNTFAHNAK